ncbi:hypothetical protein IEO70_02690 [Bacillus sp. AGMB 02131]|uniref:Uncharacterized protein n=1 Tax=Peribacillus faecalis TaxID=2772559 RepID=A0A927H9U6_9BACI|nr:hypothetical protein [Peribacillus faecalis]MBD3107259.1 hypothetical protein [Peribacillus faecalis]
MNEISDYIKASHFEYVDDETDLVEMKLFEGIIGSQNESNKLEESLWENGVDLEETLKRFRMKLANEKM